MKTGVLGIHGFTGGPYEIQPFMDYLQAQTDWHIVVPTLPGHGETLELRNVTAESWMMVTEQALRQLQKEMDRIIIVGFSMGGIIAMYLANRYPIHKLVLLSASAKYIYPAQLLQDIKDIAKEAVNGKLDESTLYKRYSYKIKGTPIQATLEFMRLIRIVQPYYGQIKVPVYIVQGKKDGIVPYATAQFIYDEIGSLKKEIVYSELGKHHICYSEDCEDWFNMSLRFLVEEEEVENTSN